MPKPKPLSQHELLLLDLLKNTIAINSPELAIKTNTVLKISCKLGKCDRAVLWAELTPDEQKKFKELLPRN